MNKWPTVLSKATLFVAIWTLFIVAVCGFVFVVNYLIGDTIGWILGSLTFLLTVVFFVLYSGDNN